MKGKKQKKATLRCSFSEFLFGKGALLLSHAELHKLKPTDTGSIVASAERTIHLLRTM